MKKVLMISFFMIFGLLVTPLVSQASSADCSAALKNKKVLWDGVELKQGQIGRLNVLQDTPLFKLDGDKKVTVKNLKKGEFYRIYAFKPGMLSVGGGLYVDRNDKVSYETPSKTKILALQCIKNIDTNPTRGFTASADIKHVLNRESAKLVNNTGKDYYFKGEHFGRQVNIHYNFFGYADEATIKSITYSFPKEAMLSSSQKTKTFNNYKQYFSGLFGDNYWDYKDNVWISWGEPFVADYLIQLSFEEKEGYIYPELYYSFED